MVKNLKDFLSNKKQRVILNGECSSWADIPFGALQCSIVWTLLFLIYINGWSVGLKSICKSFADDTFLFSVVNNVIISKNDQTVIYEWIYQWKMKFNSDLSKQAYETIFSRKVSKSFRPDVHFDSNPVNSASVCKYVGIILDSKWSFEEHLKSLSAKVN